MIDLEKVLLDKVKQILNANVPNYKALMFGSRVHGTARKFSDIDIALIGPEKIDWLEIESLKDIFAESDLPMIVDIVDFNSVTKSFKKIINKNYEIIKK
ncbi:MAG: nucleotidyltransferase domain-containing protein [Deltaproteobacteria bacterium]|jgi:predicted nucleotidyltransferase|nr:nucleotidyltransferase domain-containing protein [Deltaproteobacteria bacterium]